MFQLLQSTIKLMRKAHPHLSMTVRTHTTDNNYFKMEVTHTMWLSATRFGMLQGTANITHSGRSGGRLMAGGKNSAED